VQFRGEGRGGVRARGNPRASRTVPSSRRTGVQLAQVAVRVMMGHSLGELRAEASFPPRPPSPLRQREVRRSCLQSFPASTPCWTRRSLDGEVMASAESFRHRLRQKPSSGRGNAASRHRAGLHVPRRPDKVNRAQSRPPARRARISPSPPRWAPRATFAPTTFRSRRWSARSGSPTWGRRRLDDPVGRGAARRETPRRAEGPALTEPRFEQRASCTRCRA